MRFIDEATIQIAAGHGGPGCVSFRREAFAPRGGPDGGDGGAGGDIFFRASAQLSTLQDFRFRRTYQAPNGMGGSSTNKAGKDGDDITIRVPVGTVVKNAETGEVLIDFTEDGQIWIACKGGRGGKGNAHFTTATFQAPKFAQPGEDGANLSIKLELKLLADVGIIGFPNAGKSTLISRLSAAKPKIADYPFTTLTPNLGVVVGPDRETFVVADIPGLIKGAHRGLGLGHKFLKHMERTRIFVHLLDGVQLLEAVTSDKSAVETSSSGDDIQESAFDKFIENYHVIRKELELFNPALLHKPELVVINKGDLFESDPDLMEALRKKLRQEIAVHRGNHPYPNEPMVISAASGKGIDGLLGFLFQELASLKTPDTLKLQNAPEFRELSK